MKILINDYCGYPFELDLSNELAQRGHQVSITYTKSSGGPKALNYQINTGIEIIEIEIPFIDKQNYLKRWFQEARYGKEVVKVIDHLKPGVVISANTPLAAQRQILKYCNQANIGFIFWLQDIISVASISILTQKLGFLGKIVGLVFKSIEKKILKQSNHIITIADNFVDTLSEWGFDKEKSTIIPNWSPLEQIPVLSKINEFSQKHSIDNKFVVLYSGTMGMKHNPHIISKAAQQLQDHSDIEFVVITDGIGMVVLQEEKKKKKLDNLLLLPFQPFELFPQVLASADVLLTLLEENASVYSVPSKVWSGYCAARPSILIMPEENLAAEITNEINAGVVIPNYKSDTLFDRIIELKDNPELCETYGNNARQFAEENFKIEKIADKFEAIFENVLNAL